MLLEAVMGLMVSKSSRGVSIAEISGHVVNGEDFWLSRKYTQRIPKLANPVFGDEPVRYLGFIKFFAAFVDHLADIPASL